MEARYLMLDPRSYELEQTQMFSIDKCQFCGHTHFTYQRVLSTGLLAKTGIRWVQRCFNCKKTVSSVKRNP